MQDLQGGCEERLSERMQVVLIQGSHHVSAKKIETDLSLLCHFVRTFLLYKLFQFFALSNFFFRG